MSFLQQIIEYFTDNPKGYWFKRKLYGWGWVPVTWQGWLSTLVFIGVILLLSLILRNEPTGLDIVIFIVGLLIADFVFIAIAMKKGEKPRWQWGFKKK